MDEIFTLTKMEEKKANDNTSYFRIVEFRIDGNSVVVTSGCRWERETANEYENGSDVFGSQIMSKDAARAKYRSYLKSGYVREDAPFYLG